MQNATTTLENRVFFPKQIKHKFVIQLSNVTPRHLPKWHENLCLHSHVYMKIYSSFIYKHKNLEITLVSLQ